MLSVGRKTEQDAIEQVDELLDGERQEAERVETGATNYLFRITSGENRGDFLKIYGDGIFDSAARRIGLSRWPKPSERADAEVKASEYMQQAGFHTPETKRLDENAVLLENEQGFPLQLAVIGSTSGEAEQMGREVGRCFAGMRKNGWLDYDTNPGNYLVRQREEGYEVVSIDNEMFREDAPIEVIDSKAADVQENIRDSITEAGDTPPNFQYFVNGFSKGYGEELELKSGVDRVLRDTLDIFRY